jgi:hypothetical protein
MKRRKLSITSSLRPQHVVGRRLSMGSVEWSVQLYETKILYIQKLEENVNWGKSTTSRCYFHNIFNSSTHFQRPADKSHFVRPPITINTVFHCKWDICRVVRRDRSGNDGWRHPPDAKAVSHPLSPNSFSQLLKSLPSPYYLRRDLREKSNRQQRNWQQQLIPPHTYQPTSPKHPAPDILSSSSQPLLQWLS